MAWLESHQALDRHPKIVMLKAHMRWSQNETIGFVHRLWWLVLEYAPVSGDLRALPPMVVGELLGMRETDVAKAVEHMIEVGLIDKNENNDLFIHDWMEFGGKYQAKKDLTRQRVKRHRESCNADVRVTGALPTRYVRECNATEKRREEKNITTPYPRTGGVDGDEFPDQTDPPIEKFEASLDGDLCNQIRETYRKCLGLTKLPLDRNTRDGINTAAAMIKAGELTLADLDSCIRNCFKDPQNKQKYGLRGVLNNLSRFLPSHSPPPSGSGASPVATVQFFEGDCPSCNYHVTGASQGFCKCPKCGMKILLKEL